jgi:hypothetical protein
LPFALCPVVCITRVIEQHPIADTRYLENDY